MRRALTLLLALAALTWLEFEIFPGHTYLAGDSQIYVPAVERLDTPGFLSRDLLATHPHLTYTVYDEVTLFLHDAARASIRDALAAQQILFRLFGLLGAFLIVRSSGLGDFAALFLAALVNFGAVLTGPAVSFVDRDPTPVGFAAGLLLLAFGLLARNMPLLAGAAGGLAFVYEPVIAAPFWLAVSAALVCDKHLRRLLRPCLTILLVFILLLANLAQLQPGIDETTPFFSRMPDQLVQLQQFRTPFLWVSLWAKHDVWQFLALYVCGLWATVRIWKMLNRQLRWLFLTLPLMGALSLAFSAMLVEGFRWPRAAEIGLTRILIYTVAFAAIACGIAGVRSAIERRWVEAWLWLTVAFALPIDSRIFDFFKLTSPAKFFQLFTCVLLAGLAAFAIQQRGKRWWRYSLAGLPFLAAFALRNVEFQTAQPSVDNAAVSELAHWAEQNTWGSAMFFFPDGGRELYPGVFRAESRRAIWVDWSSGDEVRYVGSAGIEWWDRWQSAAPPGRVTSLPIDYYALKRTHELPGIKPVFQNSEFVVYDANQLSVN